MPNVEAGSGSPQRAYFNACAARSLHRHHAGRILLDKGKGNVVALSPREQEVTEACAIPGENRRHC